MPLSFVTSNYKISTMLSLERVVLPNTREHWFKIKLFKKNMFFRRHQSILHTNTTLPPSPHQVYIHDKCPEGSNPSPHTHNFTPSPWQVTFMTNGQKAAIHPHTHTTLPPPHTKFTFMTNVQKAAIHPHTHTTLPPSPRQVTFMTNGQKAAIHPHTNISLPPPHIKFTFMTNVQKAAIHPQCKQNFTPLPSPS